MTFILFYEESCAIFIFNRISFKYGVKQPNNPFAIYPKFIKNIGAIGCFPTCGVRCYHLTFSDMFNGN
jgi:hypothetical protein